MSTETMTSLDEYVEAHQITCEILHDRGTQVEKGWEHHAYQLRLTDLTLGRTIDVPWTQGLGIDTSPTDTPVDVLACLIDDVPGDLDTSFEDWAGDYGYDLDSLSAYRTWQAVMDQAPRVMTFVDDFHAVSMLERP